MNNSSIEIYVVCLASYTSGDSHGIWIDATEGVEHVREGIAAMLATSPYTTKYGVKVDEWAIHDSEGFGYISLGEYESLDRVCQIGSGILEAQEYHQVDAYQLFVEESCFDNISYEFFQDIYIGNYATEEDYGIEMAENFGLWEKIESTGLHPDYVDWGAYGRDAIINDCYQIHEKGNGFHLFRSHI